MRYEVFPCHTLGHRLHRLDVEIGYGNILEREELPALPQIKTPGDELTVKK